MKTSLLQLSFLIIQLLVLSSIYTAGQEECQPARCSDGGPIIRFPFWLKGHHPQKCGFPGFALSCTASNETQFDFQVLVSGSAENILFPIPVKGLIRDINYERQLIHTSALNTSSCLPERLPSVNSSLAPAFSVADEFHSGLTLFNCSADQKFTSNDRGHPVPCMRTNGFQIRALESLYSVGDSFSVRSCRKMYNISYVPNEFFGPQEYRNDPSVDLHWPQPYCGNCELQGKYCRLQTKTANNETECYGVNDDMGGSQSMKELSSRVVIGLCILLLLS